MKALSKEDYAFLKKCLAFWYDNFEEDLVDLDKAYTLELNAKLTLLEGDAQ